MSVKHIDEAGGFREPPRRGVIAIVLPCGVALAMVTLLALSAWPLVRPARAVMVAQAVFDRSAQAASPLDDGSVSGDRPASRVGGPTVQAAGWLEAEPFFVAASALADGVLESVEVLEGERVEAGQVVARLVAADAKLRLRQAEAELASAQAELALAQAEVDAARRTWDEPVELRRRVATGKAALAESQAELAQLPALIDGAQAMLLGLEEELARAERSLRAGAANELEVVISRQKVIAQRAERRALEARGPILEARVERLGAELAAAERDLELRIEDRRRVDAARATVAKADAVVQRARVVRDEAALELERMVIRAPMTGYVQRRLKVPGDKVVRAMDAPDSAQVVHLYDPARLQVRVDVPLADASHVFAGQRCEVIVEVLPERTFRGEVLRITHEADLQKNTLQVKVKVLDPDPVLRPEMLTRVRFLSGGGGGEAGRGDADTSADAPAGQARRGTRVLVPRQAIAQRDGGGHIVWAVTARSRGRGVVRAVPVERGEARGGWWAVRGDLQPGALVSLETRNLAPGQRVVYTAKTADAADAAVRAADNAARQGGRP